MEIVWSAVFLTILPWLGSLPGGMVTKSAIKNWYDKDLKKPSFRPPNWMFPIVWTYLYFSMGYASYLVWRDGGEVFDGPARLPLILFGIQLFLNWIWSFIFFWAHNVEWAFYEIVVLDIFIASCVYTFKPINETAAYLMMPYLAWVSFASYLSFSIWKMNAPGKSTKKKAK